MKMVRIRWLAGRLPAYRWMPARPPAMRWGVVLAVAMLLRLPVASDAAGGKAAGLPNFQITHSFLWRGGEPTADGIRRLAKDGVDTVIDLRAVTKRSRRERALAESLGLRYVQLPMSDAPPTRSQVETFLALADDAKRRAGRVFLHCQHGSDRTGAMIGIWRVTRDGWTFDQAYREMRKYHFTPKFTRLSGSVRRYAAEASRTGKPIP